MLVPITTRVRVPARSRWRCPAGCFRWHPADTSVTLPCWSANDPEPEMTHASTANSCQCSSSSLSTVTSKASPCQPRSATRASASSSVIGSSTVNSYSMSIARSDAGLLVVGNFQWGCQPRLEEVDEAVLHPPSDIRLMVFDRLPFLVERDDRVRSAEGLDAEASVVGAGLHQAVVTAGPGE